MVRTPQPQPADCFEFIWRRRTKGRGFRWKEDSHGHLVLLGPPQDALQPYEPLREETGLFLTFAHLDGSDEAFLRFANTYGRLGTYHCFYPDGGEPLEEWQRHHRWMHFLAEVRAELLKERPRVGQYVTWDGAEVIFHFPKIGTWSTETWRHRGELRECPQSKQGGPLFKPGDLRGPALWFLTYAIEYWLRETEGRGKPIAARMVWSERDQRPQFVFSPSTLLGAMVCQFAAALHGGWPFRECAYCHRFFRLAPGINRANRLTCSPTCKQYLHNGRAGRARELHAAGRTVQQIIRDLNVQPRHNKSSTEIVKTWLAKK